jgi:hydroxypyruvate reductase
MALVMSDVIDDDLSSIASGTTHYDDTTFADAISIIQKYGLERKIPQEVLDKLRQGVQGEILETPKKLKIPNYIISTNDDCLKSMEKKSKQLGLSTKTIKISGDIKKIAPELVKQIPKKKNSQKTKTPCTEKIAHTKEKLNQ